MFDFAEYSYTCDVIEGLAEARVKLFYTILPKLGEEEVIRIYGPESSKGLSQEHVNALINIIKTKNLEEGIKEYAIYLEANMDEKASKSLQACIRTYRVKRTISRLKDSQSPGWILDNLCSLYQISVREAADIIEEALTKIEEEYKETKRKRLNGHEM